ncbi:TOMM precursor leader peptide-binding protein [Staphylospora marina]|uniref:TOMM precursor leader peptide-binding protein n=1 Tax=Staphylospora marina TaxID=2490858 RepID=UPI000F5C1800|nr:TOMM precursor leader peptide-binding protein [Staphylospora marina]
MSHTVWLWAEGRLADMLAPVLEEVCEVVRVDGLPDEPGPGRPDALLLCHDARLLDREADAQDRARRWGVPFFRIHLYVDRVFAGPWVLPDEPGCVHCVEWRMSLVHPQREIWHSLAKAQRMHAEAGIHRGWSPPFLDSLSLIVRDELERLLSGKPPRLKRSIYVATDGMMNGRIHAFQPNPLCPRCGNLPDDTPERAVFRVRSLPKPHPRTWRLPNPNIRNDVLREAFYDWRTGLFPHLYRDVYSRFMPIFGAEMPLPDRKSTEIGFGRTDTFRDSELTAMLEGLERYAGMVPRGKRTVHRASWNEVRDRAIHPPEWGIHHPDQRDEPGYAYVPYSDDLKVNWVWGFSWKEQKPVLVPEQMVYYRLPDPPERPTNRFVYETSNGCAMGGSLEEAVFHALMEVIERDAFLVSWYNRLALDEIDVEGVHNRNILLVKDRVEANGYRLHLFDMTMESGIPAVWALMINPAEDAKVKTYSAAGAHPDPEKAIMGALVEVVTSVPIYEEIMPAQRDKAERMVHDPGLVQEMHDHVLLYSHPDTLPRFDFLFREKKRPRPVRELYRRWYEEEPPGDLGAELKELLDKLTRLHGDVVIIDETTPELEALGIRAVKTLVQGMLTMSFGHQYRRIVMKRVLEAPVRTGRRPSPIREEEINLFPHPFP